MIEFIFEAWVIDNTGYMSFVTGNCFTSNEHKAYILIDKTIKSGGFEVEKITIINKVDHTFSLN